MKLIKKYLLWILAALSFLIFLCLFLIARGIAKAEASQRMAERWSRDGGMAQISCFFSINAAMSKDGIEEFEHSLDSKLDEASITVDNYLLKDGKTRNENARLWADAYSADGRISISHDQKSVTVQALGVGGDFFLFHPLELLSGGFFSGNDLMQDYIVVDEDTAWQLFGSNDIAGQVVYIGNVPHIISGVVKRQSGRISKAAGLSETLAYVSYETLTRYGTINYGTGSYGEEKNAINHYEIVMPNPVRGFAIGIIRESMGRDEKQVEILENTSRFSLLSSIRNILSFGTRSMNEKAIIYPYWENIARGYEDIIALLTMLSFLFLLYPVLFLLVVFIRYWKHKGWTVKEKLLWLKDQLERYLERRREQRKKEEYFE